MIEVWNFIKGYEDCYQVSDLGRIRSVERVVPRGNHILRVKECILTPGIDKDGYSYVLLSLNGKQRPYKIHRLVASSFIDNKNNLPMVNHKNEIKSDNRALNLEWCDCKYNNHYGTAQRRMMETQTKKFGKSVLAIDKNGNVINDFNSTRSAAREMGLDSSSIRRACHGKNKTAGGYSWKYKK